jgi:hypothetical protein
VPASRHLETIEFAGSLSLKDTAARTILLALRDPHCD